MIDWAQIKRKEILVHAAWWFGYGALLSYFPLIIMDTSDAILFVLRTLIASVVIFYINAYWLLPRFIARGQYLKYLGGILVTLFVTGIIFHSTDRRKGVPPAFAHHDMEWEQVIENDRFLSENKELIYQPFRPKLKDRRFLGMSMMGIPSFIAMLFISTLFWIYSDSRQRKQHELSLVNQNLVNEMKFLKSQMNPHFLFNALNNIYSLSMLHSIKTPEMVLKLSAMLRYVLYESEDVKVKLGKEVDYIKNFIEFQRIKIEGIPNIHIDIDRADRMKMIEPMLLIPFVENSFKHSKIEDTERGWISMTLTTSENEIYFEVSNSVPSKKMAADKNSGIGVENVKRRLQYLYPGHHSVDIQMDEKQYNLHLKITTNETSMRK
ncbi:histidine kinase [Carboxylicivirga sp. A043]|uniref:sensor histidine kinase n=1 Tax=Carboxylicivirga litoralis TaxID=2816963 RepID=UPI0021CB8C15|nr:histidine kinase [Carboxylicivirga sp. A043]MCU4158106.1 histidine kinase [Carboxylicivirga sp. A043]